MELNNLRFILIRIKKEKVSIAFKIECKLEEHQEM